MKKHMLYCISLLMSMSLVVPMFGMGRLFMEDGNLLYLSSSSLLLDLRNMVTKYVENDNQKFEELLSNYSYGPVHDSIKTIPCLALNGAKPLIEDNKECSNFNRSNAALKIDGKECKLCVSGSQEDNPFIFAASISRQGTTIGIVWAPRYENRHMGTYVTFINKDEIFKNNEFILRVEDAQVVNKDKQFNLNLKKNNLEITKCLFTLRGTQLGIMLENPLEPSSKQFIYFDAPKEFVKNVDNKVPMSEHQSTWSKMNQFISGYKNRLLWGTAVVAAVSLWAYFKRK